MRFLTTSPSGNFLGECRVRAQQIERVYLKGHDYASV